MFLKIFLYFLFFFFKDLGPISYHDFEHATSGDNVCRRMIEDLGPEAKVFLLRNHGCITLGKTVHEAFFFMFELIRACEASFLC